MHNIPEGASYLRAVNSFALCKAAVSSSAGFTVAKSQHVMGSGPTRRNSLKPRSHTVVLSPCVLSACLASVFVLLFSPVFCNHYWKATKSAGLNFIFNLWEVLSAHNFP